MDKISQEYDMTEDANTKVRAHVTCTFALDVIEAVRLALRSCRLSSSSSCAASCARTVNALAAAVLDFSR